VTAYLLPAYLLVLAGFLLFVNIRAGRPVGKWLSWVGMWAAIAGSAVSALVAYR
jgi:hypothetical protein